MITYIYLLLDYDIFNVNKIALEKKVPGLKCIKNYDKRQPPIAHDIGTEFIHLIHLYFLFLLWSILYSRLCVQL